MPSNDPSRPDNLTCNEARELLSAQWDNELPAERAAALSRHLVNCERCASEYQQLRQTSARMREQLPPLTAPDILRASVRSALRNQSSAPHADAAPPMRRAWWIRQLAAGFIIAVVSSTITVIAMQHRGPTLDQTNRDIVASHVRALMANHLTDIASTDQHNVKPWFNGKTDFSPEVYRLEDAGFPLIGGRLDHLGNRAVAVIVYGRRQHIIDVYTWPEDGTGTPPPVILSHVLERSEGAAKDRVALTDSTATTERGYNALHWTHAGMRFWAISDLNVPELRQFVEAFRKSAASLP